MSDLPTGTVTFLFTDIEGSTRLLQRFPDEFTELLSAHSGIIRKAIEEAGGVEVRTEGDSFFVAFDSAPAAIKAAAFAQRGLARQPWPEGGEIRVRMGLHTGLGRLGGDDYIGLDVHRAARLASAAHGGQIVISEPTSALVHGALPEGVSLRDLGLHRFKDLTTPEAVFEVVHPDLPVGLPPLASLDSFPNNLPAFVSTFLGRNSLLAAVNETLDSSRLVTLLGPGGVGKTRLALHAAAGRIEKHRDGVWLVELGSLGDPDLVAQAARAALRIVEQAGSTAAETLAEQLARKDLLILLDNCEHLIDATARLAERLLASCPDVRILATSRESLNVAGEVNRPVPPMNLAVRGEAIDPNDPPEAVALFVERARAVEPGFELTADNADAITTICRQLDSLPLAIELAAARVRALSVADIAARLEDRFLLLSGGSRTALPRQRTLEATVAWSYDLLDPQEQLVFRRLGIFAGSFDLAAAEAVVQDEVKGWILDLVPGLVDRSLLTVVKNEEPTRYRMLETVRHYARMRLADAQESADAEAAHTAWAVTFAREVSEHVTGPQMRTWLARGQASLDDLRAALGRSIAQRDLETGMEIVLTLHIFWVLRAVREGGHWLEQLLDLDEPEPQTLARALSMRGDLLAFSEDGRAAIPHLERSLEIHDTIDDPLGRAHAEQMLALALWETPDHERVRELVASATEIFAGAGERVGLARGLFALAMWELQYGRPADAGQYAARLEQIGETTGAPLIQAHAHEVQALVAHFAAQHERAKELFGTALDRYRQAGFVQCVAHCLEHVALWSIEDGDPAGATSLLGAVVALREDHAGVAIPPFERIWHEKITANARERLGDLLFAEQFQAGRRLDPEGAFELASDVLGTNSAAAGS